MFKKPICWVHKKVYESVVRGLQKVWKPLFEDKTDQAKDSIDKAAQRALKESGEEIPKNGTSTLDPGYTLEYDPETGESFYCFHMDLPVEKKMYSCLSRKHKGGS